MNIEELTIGQLLNLQSLLGNKPAIETKRDLGLQIIVCDRGFVYVGHTVVNGDFVTVANARSIRKWGTTEGLGQLAATGKTGETILDDAGEILIPLKAVIHFIKCKSSW